tara:strand:+ start:39 stop:410 length:372 start_codon:yes stop_codon:yes gene_type:complete
MYKIKVIQYFSAAHFLRNYKGKCENLHGHNWKVEVAISGDELDTSGMILDFGDLKMQVTEVLDELDHHNLNDLDYFKEHNPSSEEIARYIYYKLKAKISGKERSLEEVVIWETQNSCATYNET